MLNTTIFINTRGDGFSVLEIQGESLKGFVPLRQSTLTGTVAGPLAQLTLTQTFSFSRAAFDGAIEALYRFPLPGDAAVLGVTVRFGEVELVATLQERAEAETEYKTAQSEGRQAALITRESPDVFTLQVAGILPDQEVQIVTQYAQLARAEENSQWSLRLPLTTAPRYVRQDEVGTAQVNANPLLTMRDPGHRFSLDLTLKGAASASCTTHHPTLTVREDGLNLRLDNVLPNQDCVVYWRTAAPETQIGLSVFTHGTSYLAQVAPPLIASNTGLPREVIVLVDHSGSMEGAKWKAADCAVTRFLSSLTSQDRFALGLFHNDCRWFDKVLRLGTSETIREATAFLQRHKDSGGTELGVALEQSLNIPRMSGEQIARHVLIVTDAEVTDTGRLLNLVGSEAKHPQRRRVSVICIDAAPNSQLVVQLAEKGGGSAHFLTSNPEQDDITTALDNLLREWDAPLYTNLVLKSGSHTQELGDLPMGQPRWIAGELSTITDAPFTLESHGETLATAVAQPGPSALKALVGVRRINALEYLLTGHHSPQEILTAIAELGFPEPLKNSTLYPENVLWDDYAYLRKLLVEESLRIGIVSSVTAFVATRKERGQLVAATIPIANALPKGWDDGTDYMGGDAFMMSAPAPAGAPSPSLMQIRGSSPKRQGGLFGAIVSAFSRPQQEDDDEASLDDLGDSDRYAFGDAVEFMEIEFERGNANAPKQTKSALFEGIPSFTNSEAVLYDGTLPGVMLLSLLKVLYPEGTPPSIDTGLVLLLFIDDLTTPRARVRLSDLLQLGGERPLNLRCTPSSPVRLVLVDGNAHWASGAPRLQVHLG